MNQFTNLPSESIETTLAQVHPWETNDFAPSIHRASPDELDMMEAWIKARAMFGTGISSGILADCNCDLRGNLTPCRVHNPIAPIVAKPAIEQQSAEEFDRWFDGFMRDLN